MYNIVALFVASVCLAAVGALFMVGVAVITYFIYRGFFWSQESNQGQIPTRAHVNASHASREPSRNHDVYDLTSPDRIREPYDFDVSPKPTDHCRRSRHSSDAENIDGCNHSASLTPRGCPPSRTYSPRQVPQESAHPVASLEEIGKGYAALLACKFTGDVAAHLSNVSAVVAAFNLDSDDICYCFLCLDAVTSSEGIDGLAIKPYGLNSYAARIWITTLARFVKFAQGHHWADDDDRVRPLADEWQYQVEHFLQLIKSREAPFRRKHGFELFQAFRHEDIRRQGVARAQQSMRMLGALTAEAPRAPLAGTRLLGAAAGINVDAKALNAPPRPVALANTPAFTDVQRFVATLDRDDISGPSGTGLPLGMRKRSQEDMQDRHMSSQARGQKRSRPALLPPETKIKPKGNRSR